MDKIEWFNLDKQEKIQYLEEKLDKIANVTELNEKREAEKAVFQIINWEEEYD